MPTTVSGVISCATSGVVKFSTALTSAGERLAAGLVRGLHRGRDHLGCGDSDEGLAAGDHVLHVKERLRPDVHHGFGAAVPHRDGHLEGAGGQIISSAVSIFNSDFYDDQGADTLTQYFTTVSFTRGSYAGETSAPYVTKTEVCSTVSSLQTGQAALFTAKVNAGKFGVPGGQVFFTVTGADASVVSCHAGNTVVRAGGAATCAVSGGLLAASGPHTVQAVHTDTVDSNFGVSRAGSPGWWGCRAAMHHPRPRRCGLPGDLCVAVVRSPMEERRGRDPAVGKPSDRVRSGHGGIGRGSAVGTDRACRMGRGAHGRLRGVGYRIAEAGDGQAGHHNHHGRAPREAARGTATHLDDVRASHARPPERPDPVVRAGVVDDEVGRVLLITDGGTVTCAPTGCPAGARPPPACLRPWRLHRGPRRRR